MARSIAQIQAALVAAKNADPVLAPTLTSTSNVAIWLLWTWVVASCQWVLETLFDVFVANVLAILAAQKPHTLQWYVTKAMAYQYGVSLPADSDVYAVVPPADPTVLVVNFAAAVELPNLVRIKVATLTGGVLGPLSSGQLTGLTTYMGKVKDAGVRLQITSGNGDNLQTGWTIYYDPTVLTATGERIDGTENTPVLDALNAFVDALPFNGVLIYNAMVAAIQAVPGVIIAENNVAQANYGATPYVSVNPIYTPDAGYLVVDEGYFNANITYVPYGV